MRSRLFMLSLTAIPLLPILGCADATSVNASPTVADEVPGVTPYYIAAVANDRRAVRKPLRDARERAMRELSRQADKLLAEDSAAPADVQLVSYEGTADATDIQAFRDALMRLRDAADALDRSEIEQAYAATIECYRRIQSP